MQELKELMRKHQSSIVFIMETKNERIKVEQVCRRIKIEHGVYVDPDGLSGGLVLWWKEGINFK